MLFDVRLLPSFLLMLLCIVLELGIQRLFFRRVISNGMVVHFVIQNRLLTILNISTMLLVYAYICRVCKHLPPLPSILLATLLVTVALKLVSYYQHNVELLEMATRINSISTNKNYRDLFSDQEIDNANLEILLDHRHDLLKLLDVRRLAYFMVAPTLCYQLSYPRNPSIRYLWIAKRLAEYVLVLGLEFVLWFEYYQPQLDALVAKLHSGDFTTLSILSSMLHFSVPTVLMWIGGFYMLFQVHLNILAELLRFADRRFYDDWWNCRTISEYWRLWNQPVHRWCLRHVYNPLLKKGFTKEVSNFLVFFVSAVLHEYIISVPLGFLSFYAFLAMLLQSPLQVIEYRFNKLLKIENSQLGNVSFWVTVCVVGEPVCIAIYYYLYTLHRHP